MVEEISCLNRGKWILSEIYDLVNASVSEHVGHQKMLRIVIRRDVEVQDYFHGVELS